MPRARKPPAKRTSVRTRRARAAKSKANAEFEKEEKEEKEESDEEIQTPKLPIEVDYPPGLGKRTTINFPISTPSRKRKAITLNQHCTIDFDDKDDSIDEEEDDKNEESIDFSEEGKARFAVSIAKWIEDKLKEEYDKDKALFPPDQSKAHLSIDERLRYEFVNG